MPSSNNREFQELVIARISAMPKGTTISIGGKGSFSKKQLIQHIKDNDDIGKQIIEVDKAFFKSLKSSSFRSSR